MTFKGYTASIEVNLEAEILFGRVLGIKDVVTFKAKNLHEAYEEFKTSVDEYLAFCKELGEEPDKSFSGKLFSRTTLENH
ncbi:HicB family protein [Calothrix sp. NIES-4071]|nr:HicB family protein [Calothrix sp. NIES-4071]BAZ63717.1 HicB family protein [Calothrix sp. NIES-4105]